MLYYLENLLIFSKGLFTVVFLTFPASSYGKQSGSRIQYGSRLIRCSRLRQYTFG